MKYGLVIDVPEPLESEDVKVDYLCYYHCGNVIENKIDVFPKPLPEKKKHGYSANDYTTGKIDGWNECLTEIAGENEVDEERQKRIDEIKKVAEAKLNEWFGETDETDR